MSDLLDMLDMLDGTGVTHALMPSMSLACGLDVLSGRCSLDGPDRASPTMAETTCPDCLTAAGGLDGLRAECRRQQGHQAPAEGAS